MESTANKERTENGLTDYNLSCRALLNINDKAGEDTEFEEKEKIHKGITRKSVNLNNFQIYHLTLYSSEQIIPYIICTYV